MGSRFKRNQLLSKWLAIAAVLCLTVSFKVGANDGGGSGKQFFRPDPRQNTKLTFDRMELEVPAGAAGQELSVELAPPDLNGIKKPRGFRVISQMYRFGPSGTKFSGGKELDLQIDLEEKNNKAKFYYINRVTKRLEQVQTQEFNKDNGKLHVKLRHFSDYVLGISSGWDGAGLNPFTDYITQGIETVDVYGHYDPEIRLNVYSVKGRGMDLDFTIASDSAPDDDFYRLGSIAPGFKLDLPLFQKAYQGSGYAKGTEISINIPSKGCYKSYYGGAKPTSSGTGNLAGWKIYNYNGNSFAINYTTHISDEGCYNEYKSVAYLSDGRCIRDYGSYQIVTDLNGNTIKYTYHTTSYWENPYDDTADDYLYTKDLIDSIEDTMGRVFYLTYNDIGNLTQIKQKLSDNSTKIILTINYNGKQVQITDAQGRVYTLLYNCPITQISSRRLKGITYPNGVSSAYEYEYIRATDSYDSITSQNWYKPNQSTAFREIAFGTVSGHVYDDNYVAVQDGITKKEYQFSDNGSVLTEKVYSVASGQLLKTVANKYATLLSGTTSAGEAYGSELLTSATTTLYKSDGSAGEAITWEYEYDDWGNITKVTDPNGTDTVMAYANTSSNQNLSPLYQDPLYTTGAAWNQMITKATYVHDPVSGFIQLKQTHYQYDVTTGNLKQESEFYINGNGYLNTVYTYDSYGNMLTKTDANENTLNFEYAATTDQPYQSAYLTKVSSSAGTTVATFDYDVDTGDKVTATDPKGNIYRYEYDAANRLTKEYLDNSNSKIGITRQITYDDTNNTVALKFGNDTAGWQEGLITYDPLCGKPTLLQRKLSDSLVTQKQFEYDTNGRLSWEQDGEGHKTTYTYDALNRKTVVTQPNGSATNYTYDDRTISITDANGNQKVQTYDLLDRLVGVKESPDMGTTSYSTTYTYDTFYDSIGGKPVYHLITTTNPKQAVTTNTYDNLGRLVKTEYPQDSNNPMTAETFTYDNVGNLLIKTNGKGAKKLEYEYFAGYRLKKVTEPDGKIVNYTYDANDNPLTQTTTGVTYAYTYDARNRVTNLKAQLDGYTFNVGYDYDAFGRVTSLTYPGRSKAINYTYDELDRIKAVEGFTYGMCYDNDNKFTYCNLENGLAEHYSYDDNDRIIQIRVDPVVGDLMELNYSYDAIGNITEVENQFYDSATKITNITTDYYDYDGINRLTWYGNLPCAQKASATGTGWSYDGAGNMTTKETYLNGTNQGSVVFGYDNANRLLSMGTTTYSNNTAGARTKKVQGTNTWTYDYDGESRLTQVNKNSATQAQCSYDGAGMRYKKVENGKTIYYIYSGSNPLMEYSPTEGQYTYRIYAGKQAIAEEKGGVVKYYHKDHLGSTRLVTDASGQKIASYSYEPYGKTAKVIKHNAKQDDSYIEAVDAKKVGYCYSSSAKPAVTGGNTVTIKVWAKGAVGGENIELFIFDYADDSSLYAHAWAKSFELTTEWKQYTFTQQVTATATRVWARVDNNVTGNTVYWCSPELNVTGVTGNGFDYINQTPLNLMQFFNTRSNNEIALTDDCQGSPVTDETAYQFTDKTTDESSGLSYFGARFYDPEVGRFLTVDPKQDGLNWYAYCYDNPLKYLDPNGLKPIGSSVFNQSKYTSQEDRNKAYMSVISLGGLIPSAVTDFLGKASMVANSKVDPHVVVFEQRTAFIKEATEKLNKVNEKLNALLSKETLKTKDFEMAHKLQTEKERLEHEIKVNKDYEKKETQRIEQDFKDWIGPDADYIDNRSDEISGSTDSSTSDKGSDEDY